MGAGEVHALSGIDLEIDANSFTVVMGPSGSGKSTLLYLLGGLDRPTDGSIEIEGQRVDQLDENELAEFRRHKVGFIFQSFNLISNMTALQNIVFPMRFARVPSKQRLPRASQLLERVGLADRVDHHPTELSGGQQQRVAIARALVNDPQLILADEPTGNLDSGTSKQIVRMLADLNKNQGLTVIMISHEESLMAEFADEVIGLCDGRIVERRKMR